MKNKLYKLMLATVAVAFSTPMLAGDWTLPTPRLQHELKTEETVYLYNVEKGQFLAAGGAWGTHAALANEGFPYVLTEEEENVYTLFSSSAKAGSEQLLARENPSDVYTDYAGRESWCKYWVFSNGSQAGYYRMSSPENDANFGTEAGLDCEFYQLGWNPEAEDLTNGNGASMGTNVSVYMLNPETEGAALDWAFVSEADYETYFVRYELYAMLNKAEEKGVSTTAFEQVYNNLNATTEEIQATIVALQESINANNSNSLAGATDENPVDATSFIVNPSFDNKSGEGWTYSGFEPKNNRVWTGEDGAVCDNFMEIWNGSPVGNASLTQTIEGLPAGHYVLGLDGLACRQGQSTLEVSGVTIYVEDATRTETRMFTYKDSPKHFELDFIHGDGALTIGVSVESTDANFVLVDNFTLSYHGKTSVSPFVMVMNAAARQLEPYADTEAYTYSKATAEKVTALLAKAGAFAGNDDEAVALTDELNAMTAAVKAEISAYKTLAELVAKCEKDINKFETMPELQAELADLKYKYEEAYTAGTYSVEDIAKAKSEYTDYLTSQIMQYMEKATSESPVDITALYDNMGYEDNTKDNWSCTTGWTVRSHVAEVYQNTFKMSRTISGLPAGKYIVKVKGFYRNGGSKEDYQGSLDESNDMNAYLFANGKETGLAAYTAGISTQKYDGYTEVAEGLYCPNTMESSETAFNLDDRYQVEVSAGVMNDGGDLTFGVEVENAGPGGYWTCWSQFQIVYCGEDNQIYFDALEILLDEALAVQEDAMSVRDANEKLEKAMEYAAQVLDDNDAEHVSKAVADLNEAIEYAKPIPALIEKLADIFYGYYAMLDLYFQEDGDPTFETMLDEIACFVEDGDEIESVEQINTWIKDLCASWTKYIQYATLETASEENPADISPVILNNSFENPYTGQIDAGYWNLSYDGNAGGGTEQREISTCWEFWNSMTYDINQNIRGLADGYYTLSCQAFYRPFGGAGETASAYEADPEANLNALLYAQVGDTEYAAPINNIMVGAVTESLGVNGETTATYGGETIYVPNSMEAAHGYFEEGRYPVNNLTFEVKDGKDVKLGIKKDTGHDGDWTMMDDFQLFYLGKTAPTAINAVTESAHAVASIYDLNGRKQAKLTRGVNIVKGENGKSKLVIVSK